MQRLELQPELLKSDLYAVAYRVAETDGVAQLSIWQEPLTVGEPLLLVPLFLKSGVFLPLDLDHTYTYTYTCLRQRIPDFR